MLLFVYYLRTKWYSSCRKGRINSWSFPLSSLKSHIFSCHVLNVTNFFFLSLWTHGFYEFQSIVILIFTKAQFVPNLASGNLFKFSHVSFWFDTSILWYLPCYLVWQDVLGSSCTFSELNHFSKKLWFLKVANVNSRIQPGNVGARGAHYYWVGHFSVPF